jgi:deoxyadenosine/deoxycytidine kinase
MDDRDYENYREIFRNMTAFLQPPDLILYLKCRPETALDRIRQRARSCESEIPLEFLCDLDAAYNDWIERAPALCPVRTLDTEQVNLRDDPAARAELLGIIRDFHLEKHEKAVG